MITSPGCSPHKQTDSLLLRPDNLSALGPSAVRTKKALSLTIRPHRTPDPLSYCP